MAFQSHPTFLKQQIWIPNFSLKKEKESNFGDLIQAIKVVLDQISLKQLKRLVSNMHHNIQVVILANGGNTRW